MKPKRKPAAARSWPALKLGVVASLVAAGAWLGGRALVLYGGREALAGDQAGAARAGRLAPVLDGKAPARTLAARDPARVDARLQADLDAIVERFRAQAARAPGAGSCTVAFSVRARESGAEIASREADRALRPASNAKLLTTSAALALLGPAYRFRTAVAATAAPVDGVLAGDLVVRAGGDPLYEVDAAGRVEPRLTSLARELAAQGIREVRGRLVLDEGDWPAPAPGPGWPDASQHWEDYCARVAGFAVNAGILTASVTPRTTGAACQVELHPWPSGLAEKLAVATGSGSANDVRVGATLEAVTVAGSLGQNARPVEASFAHPDPVLGFGAVLARELAAAGIHVLGGSARQRHVEAPVELAELVTPLVAYLDDVNTHSVNPVADAIFLELARAVRGTPTREAGGAAVADALARLGVSPAGLVQVDGSGLSREDRSSAAQITALVCAVLAADAASAELFRSSLAVAGETGTLEGRMGGDSPARARVRAKTGFIAGVSALSGVALLADGRERVFSILVEYSASIGGLNTSCWKPMQDALCERLVAP